MQDMPTFDPCSPGCGCETCLAKQNAQDYRVDSHMNNMNNFNAKEQLQQQQAPAPVQRGEVRRFTSGAGRGKRVLSTTMEEPEQAVVDIPEAKLALEFDLPPILDRKTVEDLVLNAFASGYVSATLTGQGCPYDQAQKQRLEKVKCFAQTLKTPKVRVVASRGNTTSAPLQANLIQPSRFGQQQQQQQQPAASTSRPGSYAPPPPVEFFNRFKQARHNGGHMHTGSVFAPVPPPPSGRATPMSEAEFTNNN